MLALLACLVLTVAEPPQAKPAPPATPSPPATTALIIVGAHVLGPSGNSWLDDFAILIDHAKITAVEPLADLHPPADAKSISVPGLYVIPGLIDLHTHLLLHPYNEAKWDDQVLRESLESRTIRGTVAARATVEAGFTTIRELGTEGAGWADVALRDSIDSGLITGPRIFAATRAIVATGCYGPAGLNPRAEALIPKGAQEADGTGEIRKAVREQIAAGADWIKLYTDYRRSPGAPPTATFSIDEIRAAVDEASSADKPVAAHATTDEGIRRAIEGGVTTIEHGYGASRETFELMKFKSVTLCPTMAAAEAVALYAGWRPPRDASDDRPPPAVALSRSSLKLAMEVGVIIACGSDAGVFPHGDNARELELMVKDGMKPADAIGTATRTAARVLGREGELGVLQKGAAADIVVLRSDPLSDTSALRNPVLVIARGRIIVDKR